MGSCWSRDNADRNVNNRVCSASKIRRVCDRSTTSLQFDSRGTARETSQCAFKRAIGRYRNGGVRKRVGRYRFAPGDELISELGKLFQLEHQCCPFLTFGLTVEPEGGSVLLEM